MAISAETSRDQPSVLLNAKMSVVGFNNQSGPTSIAETLTFTIAAVNDAPVIAGGISTPIPATGGTAVAVGT
jgi:hypothetical protein